MGLDITAYKHAILTPVHDREDDCWKMDHEHVFAAPGLEAALEGLVPERCYQTKGEVYSFRAGSYSGYNAFRAKLCEVALGVPPEDVWSALDKYKDKPFYYLINFSDCEGVIGPVASAKLAKDFLDNRERVKPQLDIWFQESYDDWTHAFQLAAGSGLMSFH